MLPDDSEHSLVEKIVIMAFVMDQKDWLIMCLLARCGGDAKITKEELDFVRKTYSVDNSVSSVGNVLTDVHMKLKLKV
jgi:hypothetical protein